ncbi:hypothetical protein BD410DRAFT_734385, partial [Rickenella mellea]
VRCRYYPSSRTRPYYTFVPARCADGLRSSNRYLNPEFLFDDAAVQPYVHDCIIHVQEGETTHTFVVFYKRHVRLSINRAISSPIRGDVIIARVGSRNKGCVVNMRGRDAAVSDWVVARLVSRYCRRTMH